APRASAPAASATRAMTPPCMAAKELWTYGSTGTDSRPARPSSTSIPTASRTDRSRPPPANDHRSGRSAADRSGDDEFREDITEKVIDAQATGPAGRPSTVEAPP